MEDVEIRPKNAPCITNMMIEALDQHNRRQKEARDCQEYQQQQDSTASPRATFSLPRTVDWDVTTELDPTLLEGVEGTMAAPESSSFTTASKPSESTVPIPEKKKITLDEYNCHKALKLQQTVASPDLDENGEHLDYDDFELEDVPDNIQTNRWLCPHRLVSLLLRTPPCLCHRQPLNCKSALAPVVSRVPWSTPPQQSIEPPASAGDCQCEEQCQYEWERCRIQHHPCK